MIPISTTIVILLTIVYFFLHNKRAEVLKTLALLKGNQRFVVINVPWYLEA